MAAETETDVTETVPESMPEQMPEQMPDSIDVAGAVAMLDDAAEPDPATPAATQDSASQDQVEEDLSSEAAEGSEGGAPEFWSADDKAAWQDVPASLRPMIAKYEQQRIAFVNEKAREAADQVRSAREEAERVAQGAAGIVEQAASWWQQNGPAFQQAFADKWSQVDWNKLAADNPAEWARLKQQRDNEATLLIEANRRGQADIAVANERAERAFLDSKRVEHAKLASRLPEYFAPDKANQTYDELGKFLFAKGIAADRINAIYEAPIIELALAAMRFEQAQKLALRSRQTRESGGGDAGTTAKTTPTRVAPGPAGRTGNRNADAARQVGERFRRSGGASIADAAELIRLNEL